MNKKTKNRPLARALDSEKWSALTASLLAIVLSILTGTILLLIMGKNPIVAYASFLQGSGFLPKANYGGGVGQLTDFFDFLNVMAPMLLASLAFIVAYSCGLFNIGIAGQMLMAGYTATVLVGYNKELPAVIAKPLVIVIGILVGGLLGAFIGFLKYKFNIHEVVSTIMVNYIISYMTGFSINKDYADPVTRLSRICSSEARLTWTKVEIAGVRCNIPLGIVIALISVFVVKFISEKTVFGFELRAVGRNRRCANYIGINTGRKIVQSMMLSGIFAGLAGVTYYLGYVNTIQPKTLVGMGYDAIAVALLGSCSPVGSIFSAILVTLFQQGANYLSSMIGVAKEVASVLTGILLLYSACGGYFRYLAHRRLEKDRDQQILAEKAAASEQLSASENVGKERAVSEEKYSGSSDSASKSEKGEEA